MILHHEPGLASIIYNAPALQIEIVGVGKKHGVMCSHVHEITAVLPLEYS